MVIYVSLSFHEEHAALSQPGDPDYMTRAEWVLRFTAGMRWSSKLVSTHDAKWENMSGHSQNNPAVGMSEISFQASNPRLKSQSPNKSSVNVASRYIE